MSHSYDCRPWSTQISGGGGITGRPAVITGTTRLTIDDAATRQPLEAHPRRHYAHPGQLMTLPCEAPVLKLGVQSKVPFEQMVQDAGIARIRHPISSAVWRLPRVSCDNTRSSCSLCAVVWHRADFSHQCIIRRAALCTHHKSTHVAVYSTFIHADRILRFRGRVGHSEAPTHHTPPVRLRDARPYATMLRRAMHHHAELIPKPTETHRLPAPVLASLAAPLARPRPARSTGLPWRIRS